MQTVVGRYVIENFNPTRKDNLVSEIKKMKDNILPKIIFPKYL